MTAPISFIVAYSSSIGCDALEFNRYLAIEFSPRPPGVYDVCIQHFSGHIEALSPVLGIYTASGWAARAAALPIYMSTVVIQTSWRGTVNPGPCYTESYTIIRHLNGGVTDIRYPYTVSEYDIRIPTGGVETSWSVDENDKDQYYLQRQPACQFSIPTNTTIDGHCSRDENGPEAGRCPKIRLGEDSIKIAVLNNSDS